MNRWWVYQRERFPLLAHGPLIVAFSFSAVSYSAQLRGPQQFPGAVSALVAFVTALIFFAQLRIADEWKDYEEDSRYRPYRAVPRGLVTLRELAIVGACGAAVQFALALWLKPQLVLWLLLVWTYLALMSKEFFAREWLKARPFTYMWTHMLIMPFIDFYATACEWVVKGKEPPVGLIWFLLISFFNGIVIEIGRKIRAPEDEETGVDTYTKIWGRLGSVVAWLIALVLTAANALLAARHINFLVPVAVMLGIVLCAAGVTVRRFLQQPTTHHAKFFEAVSGVWTLLMYLSVGAIPLLLRMARSN